jgi:predicted nucleic acid-binding protein
MPALLDATVLLAADPGWDVLSARLEKRSEEEFFISTITAAELLQTALMSSEVRRRTRRVAFVEAILDQFPLLSLDRLVARMHAQIQAQLAEDRERVPLHDSWLAATCLAHGLILITRDARELGKVRGLEIESWS